MISNDFAHLCPHHIPCPHTSPSFHPMGHDLHCALPARYAHETHWAICQHTAHPDVVTWEDTHLP